MHTFAHLRHKRVHACFVPCVFSLFLREALKNMSQKVEKFHNFLLDFSTFWDFFLMLPKVIKYSCQDRDKEDPPRNCSSGQSWCSDYRRHGSVLLALPTKPSQPIRAAGTWKSCGDGGLLSQCLCKYKSVKTKNL